MSEFDINQATGISFQHLFGENGDGNISMERVEAFLNRVVEVASDQAKVNPNALVRVMHGKRVTWMTQEQASEYLESTANDASLKKDIETALKGKLKNIRQELEILLALARYTLGKFKENALIPAEQIKRYEPSLVRRETEISTGISETAESESIVEEKRRRNPVISEFEDMMGQFLQAKSSGNMQLCAQLAKTLETKKRQYVLFSRSIEPDVHTIYYHRLNLQKTKKRLLHTQNELCVSRKGSLVFELKELKKNIMSVKEQTNQAEIDGQGTAKDTIRHQDAFDINQMKEDFSEKVVELESLKRESAILDKQESSVDNLIQTISEQVLGESSSDSKMDVQAQLKKEQMKARPKSASSAPAPPKQKRMGMHVKKR